jgi:hypothetical protein
MPRGRPERRPLRKVVHAQARTDTWMLLTLECGHLVTRYDIPAQARCDECRADDRQN